MRAMSASTPLTPFIRTRQKPQAKSLSPVSRNLFGQSDATVVRNMLEEVILSERQKATSELNFDIYNETPLKHEQQENISELDRTPEVRRRYIWKSMKSADAPEFYSRRYKGKKSLMPVDLLNCSPEPSVTSGRSRSVRRSLNGYLRTPSKEMEQKSVIRPASSSRLQPSPLRTLSPLRLTDSPAFIDDSTKSRILSTLPRPTPVHAYTENEHTAKAFTPVKPVVSRLATRCPLSQRENKYKSARALDFATTPKKSAVVITSNQVTDSKTVSSWSFTVNASSNAEKSSTSLAATPNNVPTVPSSMRQLKITEMAPKRKVRSPTQKARKRLNLSEDTTADVPSTKTQKLSSGGN